MNLFGFQFTKGRTLVIAIIIAVLMTVPTLRYIVWWLLPLGSGWDDIIGGAALITIAVLVFIEIWTKRYEVNPYNRKRERRPW